MDDIVEFAHAKRDWLQERLELPGGIPCADTSGASCPA